MIQSDLMDPKGGHLKSTHKAEERSALTPLYILIWKMSKIEGGNDASIEKT